MKTIPVICIFLSMITLQAFAASEDDDKTAGERSAPELEEATCLESDRDKDGTADYMIWLDEQGSKLYEELDFNYDGAMDDFYFYTSGILSRREIDTNYDEKVDVWVYLYEGVYIERYERDLDFDGSIDLIKDFSVAESAPL